MFKIGLWCNRTVHKETYLKCWVNLNVELFKNKIKLYWGGLSVIGINWYR